MPIEVKSGRIVVEGTQVSYTDTGHNTGKTPMILLHGTAGNARSHFGYLAPMLSMRHRLITIDLALPDTLSGRPLLDQLAVQIEAVIRHLVPDRPVTLAGYSLGAILAAMVAARLRIQNLVLMAGWLKTDTQQKRRNSVWQSLRRSDMDALRNYATFCSFSPVFLANKPPREINDVVSRLLIDEFVDMQMTADANVDISALTPKISARTLVIGATYDLMVPVHQCKALFSTIANASYTEIGAGHAMLIERPAEIVRLISDFLLRPQHYRMGAVIPAHAP